ncbi:hypothetical protein GALMADRAFT_217495 [Galerina marginata CBS 339.88]|uniref:Uncharacterized protein n=1 Tax=Galerina marginata (strain CBS 339.88) TaxID=685588 RepID=A0A067SCX2_GALM3|nr:hypothetical protein GALMADRAFT_217495 [Galerina marginata CBS 339.88]
MHEFGFSKEKAEELYNKKGCGLRSNGSMGKKKTTNVEEDREIEEGSQSRVPKRPINGDGGALGFSTPQNFPGLSSLADECSTNGVRASKRKKGTAIANISTAPLDLNGDSSTFRAGEAEASMCLPTRSLAPLVAPPSHIEVRVLKSHSETLARQLSVTETKYDEVISKLEVAIEDKSTVNAAIANLQAELETMKQRNGFPPTSTKGVGTTRILTRKAVQASARDADDCKAVSTENLCEAPSPERTVWEAEKNSIISGLAIETPQKQLLEAFLALEKINNVLIRLSQKSQEETMTQLKDLKAYVEKKASKFRGYG